MNFPNAYKGVKKLFIAEIISIAAGLVAVVAAVLALVGLQNEPALVAGGTLGIVAGIAGLISFIFQLIGLFQGGRDSLQIKYAFFITIFGVVVGLVSAILSTLPANTGLTLTIRILDTLGNIASVLALAYILLGISALAAQLNDDAMEAKGRKLAFIVVGMYVVTTLLGLYPSFFINGAPDWLQTMMAITSIVAAVIELIIYILVLIFYAKAIKMLKEEK